MSLLSFKYFCKCQKDCKTDVGRQQREWSDRQAVLGAELLAARLTVVRTLAGVQSHVRHQAVSGVERSWADGARVWPLPSVLHHVLLQVGSVLESPAAHPAHLRLLPGVHALVHMQCARAVEDACTAGALVARLAHRARRLRGLNVLTRRRYVTADRTRQRVLRLYMPTSLQYVRLALNTEHYL